MDVSRIRELLAAASKLDAQLHAAVVKVTHEERGPVTCSEGCAYCCYQKILAHAAVGAAVYLHLLDAGRWTSVMREALAESDRAQTADSHGRWVIRRIPCPFLAERSFGKGRCTIYSARPDGCRYLFSFTKRPEKCAAPKGQSTLLIIPDGGPGQHPPREVLVRERLLMEVSNMLGARWDIFTFPGSILYAEALIEGLPDPGVFRIDGREHAPSFELETIGSLAEAFDRLGKEALR